MNNYVKCDQYGSPIDVHLESHDKIDTIEVKIPKEIYGWVVDIIDDKPKLRTLVDLKVCVRMHSILAQESMQPKID